jgi:hypothetical protein
VLGTGHMREGQRDGLVTRTSVRAVANVEGLCETTVVCDIRLGWYQASSECSVAELNEDEAIVVLEFRGGVGLRLP